MELDAHVCSRARISRDARFDGRFFIGVKTTRIYCRPICPVRAAKEKNVRYFPTAAAAAEAGYRPCLRCRPESAPGTPAWLGSSTTVSRALRLISEGALEEAGVDVLATRLGVGSRQLRRLFLKHLGATPIAVAKTRRLHFAKKLIDETRLPLGEIALAAGFGSVRRFNAAFRQAYKRTPSLIRKRAHFNSVKVEDEYIFHLNFRPPFHWDALLDFLNRCAIPGVEAVRESCYLRTISLKGYSGILKVSHDKTSSALQVHISFPEPRWLFLIVEGVRRVFDINADPHEIATCLSADADLAERIQAMPGLRVPGCWDGLESAVKAILAEQVSQADANKLAENIVRTYGTAIDGSVPPLTHMFPSPEVLSNAELSVVGLPQKLAVRIRALAQAVCEGRVIFSSDANVRDFLSCLLEVPGIAERTAQQIAMRTLGDPDAFPSSDLELVRAASLPSESELTQRAEAWRPWRAYAAMYLLQGNLKTEKSEIQTVAALPFAPPTPGGKQVRV